jgi:cobalt/nickel transport system permease protein
MEQPQERTGDHSMHLPDGYLSDPVCLATTVLSSASLAGCIVRLRSAKQQSHSQTMALVSAGIFAAQMLNFPIGQGTSGHVLGAAGAAILLGPYAAALCMSVVVGLQCLLFADGGLQSLGANLFNMAIVAPLVAAVAYRALAKDVANSKTKLVAVVAAGLASVLAAALACSVELALSDAENLSTILSPMLGWHAAIGLAEGLMTCGVLYGLNLVKHVALAGRSREMTAAAVVLMLLISLAPLVSRAPDALERVSLDYDFSGLVTAAWAGIAPDYAMPGVTWEFLAVALAGLMGLTAVYLTAILVSRAATCKAVKSPGGRVENQQRLTR